MDTDQAQLELSWSESPAQQLPAAGIGVAESGLVGSSHQPKGVVYTKSWVVDLILDLAGYRPTEDLASCYAIEPAAGAGAFLVPMIGRLLESVSKHGRKLADAENALHAYELDEPAAARAVGLATAKLRRLGVDLGDAQRIAKGWVTVGDYLIQSRSDRRADFVVGNPPYIRYDDLPDELLIEYRGLYPTMVGRCDIYVGFIEAGLRQLKEGAALGFICADRWMRSAYGIELRRLVNKTCAVEAVIEMHDAPAFEDNVAAYPAIVIIRRAAQSHAIVASADAQAGALGSGENLADAVIDLAAHERASLPGFRATRVPRWFDGSAPWPSQPDHVEVVQRLESSFNPLEDPMTGTKVGIGVATGADRIFVTTDANIAEPERLLPLAMAADTRDGIVQWSGHYLVDPWSPRGGLVDLDTYPRLRAYFETHRAELEHRNIARRSGTGWYRTIDRVHHELISAPKLYFPDMKLVSNPTLDNGETYPHHNLYYVTSTGWDLEVLGGLLLSRVAQLFIEAYCVKMRGGTLRFQAQYLRRIRVPMPGSLSPQVAEQLRTAFRSRDTMGATSAAIIAYGIEDVDGSLLC